MRNPRLHSQPALYFASVRYPFSGTSTAGDEDILSITVTADDSEYTTSRTFTMYVYDYTYYGTDGDDNVDFGLGNNVVWGGDEGDTLEGDDNADTIIGGAGGDSINGDEGNDLIYGGQGNDTIDGSSNDDTIYGGEGDDTLLGNWSEDYVYGEAGNDDLSGGAGFDTMYGGEGNDTVDYSNNLNGITIDLETGETNAENGDQVLNVENVVGSNLNDTITGSTGDNTLIGGAGDEDRAFDEPADIDAVDDGHAFIGEAAPEAEALTGRVFRVDALPATVIQIGPQLEFAVIEGVADNRFILGIEQIGIAAITDKDATAVAVATTATTS